MSDIVNMKIEINPQKVYAAILAYLLSFLSLIALFNGITNGMGFGTSWDSYILIGILLGMYLVGFFCLFLENVNQQADCLIVIVFFVCAYLYAFAWLPRNSQYLFTTASDFLGNPLYSIFVFSLPGYLFARQLKDYSRFCNILRRYAYLVVGSSIIIFFFMKSSFASQYLSFSYNMLLHLLFLVFFKPEKGRILHSIIVVLGIFVFALGGARGALISFLVCCVAYFLVARKQTVKKLVITATVSAGVGVIMIMKDEILALLLPLLAKMNIESRTIKYILASKVLSSSGRDDIAMDLIENINIFGHGMMGDRVICSGLYAHNMFLELICDFGIIFGIALSMLIIAVVVIGVIVKIKNDQKWIILLVSTGFLKLMLSGSYLDIEPAFYVLMGFCVNSFMESRADDTSIEENLYSE